MAASVGILLGEASRKHSRRCTAVGLDQVLGCLPASMRPRRVANPVAAASINALREAQWKAQPF